MTEAESPCSSCHLAEPHKARNTNPYGAFDVSAPQGRRSLSSLLRQTAPHQRSPSQTSTDNGDTAPSAVEQCTIFPYFKVCLNTLKGDVAESE